MPICTTIYLLLLGGVSYSHSPDSRSFILGVIYFDFESIFVFLVVLCVADQLY